ncbi:MAG TPA: TonB-dependent receptor plug domain-containing protein [Woeseiaceae bacterium]|nr:TonB-dependent receptor plug domain-containing protein [Woeseiaceae bacterium]
MNQRHLVPVPGTLSTSLLLAASAVAQAQAIEEIVVTADFRERAASEIPASVTTLDAEEIEQLAVQHFEELINVVPNLNWSGDGHRARYLQIRGVGELEQYQGAPNPSVGFLIDDIDFSGIGTIATTFDLQRIEVLRGPQGTRYGANALAGLVYVQSTLPSAEPEGRVQLTAGGDDTLAGGVALGGPLNADESLLFRASAHHHESNGFRDNRYLGRDDTNGRDETTLRGRLRWQPADTLSVDLAALYADVDDGYDAFAIDNSLTMLSDKPGRDAQRSRGGSLRIEWSGLSWATLTSITAAADSDINFDFDADWGNDDSWAPITYDFVSLSDRSRSTVSQEIRLASSEEGRIFGDTTDWLAGLYVLELEDDLVTTNRGEYFDPGIDFADSLDDTFGSTYEATNVALFGQLDHDVGTATRLSVGLRVERRTADYSDTEGLRAAPSETMSGGEITLSHDHSDALTSFLSLSKGYKAGGFNLGIVPEDRREFDAESMWNLEAGIKSVLLDGAATLNVSAFYSRREDQQVRTSFQLDPGDPASFVFFTDNAARGRTLGLEAELRWAPAETLELYANVGLLDAEFDEFVTPQVDLSGRAQAHAPDYTFAAGASYQHPSGIFARLDVSARDTFYFDVSHDQKSQPYELASARLGYAADTWSIQLWARNLFDRYYAVRGFYFGNEPPDFPATLYTRAGDPRQLGLTFDMNF